MSDLVKTHCDAMDKQTLALATDLARELNMPLTAAYDALVAEFVRRVKTRSPSVVAENDARTAQWRVRVRLYNALRMDEPEADSDPDLPPDHPGQTVLNGLPAVAEHLAQLASTYHRQSCAGLDHASLMHRLKSLRPTISRRGGDATWRVPYRIFQAGAFEGDKREQEWLARVDVERIK